MKLRIISFISLLIWALAVVGCGNKEIEERQESTIKESENSASVENEGNEVITKDDNSKVLVVYYSTTGSTKRVADMIAAWPINTFVMNNDFTGKVVIPFCTSTSSVSETEIKNWINSLQQK